jgi:peptide deformylase
VKRKEKVTVKGVSPDGLEIEIKAEGILAIALQHEIDHLNGILIIDFVTKHHTTVLHKRFLNT